MKRTGLTLYVLLMQYIACHLANWQLTETVFILVLTLMWLGIFSYVFYKFGSTDKIISSHPPRLITWFIVVALFSMVSPVLSIISWIGLTVFELSKMFDALNEVKSTETLSIDENSGEKHHYMNSKNEGLNEHYFIYNDQANCTNAKLTDDLLFTSHSEIDVQYNDIVVGSISCENSNDVYDINPATGLLMLDNCIDTGGNPYGINNHD